VALRDATTGDIVAEASSSGVDFAAVLAHARNVGGPALRALTFHERAAALKSLAKHLSEIKEEFYELSYRTGATKNDSLDRYRRRHRHGVRVFASKAARELPNSACMWTVRSKPVQGRHLRRPAYLCVTRRRGRAHQRLQFSGLGHARKTGARPCSPACRPSSSRRPRPPISPSSWCAASSTPESCRRAHCSSCAAARGSVPSPGLPGCVSFTGSAHTAERLRTHPAIMRHAVPFIAETDSLNSSIFAPDARSGSAGIRSLRQGGRARDDGQGGQKCTAIRKALVPAAAPADVVEPRCRRRCAKLSSAIRAPRACAWDRLVSQEQRTDVLARVADLAARGGDSCSGDLGRFEVKDADRERGASCRRCCCCAEPQMRRAPSTKWRPSVPWRPCCRTAIPRGDRTRAARRRQSRGLGVSVPTMTLRRPNRPWACAVSRPRAGGESGMREESTGHGSPLAPLIHGGPGRAGGGEEMGGIRGVLHYMQRTAVQGSPDAITAMSGRWVRGSRLRDPGASFSHSIQRSEVGRHAQSAEREVTVEDIEQFAALSGDNFYAHMSESEAARNPSVRRPGRARLLSDLGRGRTVRRSGVWSRARQLRHRQAALRQAGEARR
jgi:oxepin-CoA hydrolase/3-oxo-5,6-dehydrosuberyl-CoA semialdehyde dehydrogenase